MTARELLPQRRAGQVIEFTAGNLRYVATVNRFADGRPAEVFLRAGKAGTDVSVASIETAIVISFAWQYGVPLEAIRAAMPRNTDGSPEGPMGTLLDLLAGEK